MQLRTVSLVSASRLLLAALRLAGSPSRRDRRRPAGRHRRRAGRSPARRAVTEARTGDGGVGQPDREPGRPGHPAAGRQRGGRGGGGRLRAGRGAPRGRQHRRRRLHGHPPGATATVQTLDYRETAPAPRHPRHVPRLARRADRPERHRPPRRRGAGRGGRAGRGAPPVRAAAVRSGDRAGHPPGARRLRGGRVPQPVDRAATARGWRASRPRARSFLPDGEPPRRARCCAQPDLAATLEAIRDRGADGFYRGPGGRPDRGRDGARRRPHHARRTSRATRPIWRDPIAHHAIAATRSTRCRRPRPAASRWARS